MIGPITLPWPDKSLKPNGNRVHWAVKSKAAKSAKNTAFALTKQLVRSKLDWPKVRVHWEFRPKTRHAIDEDNWIAACKHYQDGIALALGIDDSLFKSTRTIGPPIKGGAVIVTIEQGENNA